MVPRRYPAAVGQHMTSAAPRRRVGEPSATEVLAQALCDAMNGETVWEKMPLLARITWVHNARKAISRLAAMNWICVPMKELEALEREDQQT